MFVPQSIQTQLELANIADVKRQIISPRHSKPIIEFKQDTPLGSYLMTYKVRPVDFHDMMNLAMYCNNIDIFNIKKEMYDTQKLYSLIIPSLINYSDGKVNIVNGKLLAGAVTGGTMNSKIVNYSWDRHGPDVTKTFYDNAQRLITNWLLMYGFSVGLGDATTDQEVLDDVKAYCEIKQMEVDKLITEMENNPDTLDPETFEQNLYQTLKASDGEITKKVYDNLKKKQDNNFFFMIESKSKGSPGNIGQIIGGLGQNVLEFKRIKKKVNNRTLPHFFQNDDRGLARGFIPNSFYHGLTPTEFYFHHMTAREGMIDTAIKTSESGYLQRKLIKGLEDLKVAYDKTVRSGNNVVMQLMYGDNGISQTHYKENEIKLVSLNDADVKKMFSFSDEELNSLATEFKFNKKDFTKWNNDLLNQMKVTRDQLRKIQMKARMNYITIQNSYQLPVNFVRIIEDAKNLVVNTKQERLNPIYVNHAIGFILRPDITRINILKKNFSETDVKYRDQTRAKYLLKVALMEYLSPRRCIFEYKLTKPQFDQMVYEIIRTFRKACVEPGEMVGTLTAQSLGETLTQMTLNSVSYSDQIYYKTENNCEIVKIGEMIDKLLENDKEKIIKIDNETKTEFLDVSKLNYMIPSVDENGKMHWKLIEAVTKHLPGGNVIKVKTLTGREVIATKSKSFLIRRNNKIVEIEGSSIKIGDKLPVQRNSPKLDQYLEYLDLSQYLSKKEYIYGSEVQKAIKHRDTCGLRCWFQDGNNKNLFVVPYQRSDSVGVGTQRNPELLTSTIILPHNAGPCSSKLTETILLDELCGFFFGAYLAEGCVNDTQVIISNNDESYRNKIALFADRYEIKYHTQIQHDKNFAGATSSDIRLHSTMLCKVINESCGRHAQNKHIPGWALIANNNFVKGLLDGYFSGDGTVNKRDTFICASSASKQLLIGISELLSRFGIMCKLSQHIMTHNNVGSEHIFPVNTLTIRNNNVNVFAKKIGFSLEYKQLLAEESYDKDWKTGNGRFDVIPGVNFGNFDKEYSRFELEELHVISTGHKKQIITDILNEDVYYDEITEITEAPLDQFTPDHDKVYDLTVADTKNFNMFGGLCMRDTFHSSGIGVKGMQGIPRFREILSYSKKISTPYMIIKLVPEVRADPNIAHKIEADLKHTLLGNLVDHMDIIYDPTPKNIHEKDKMNMKNIYYISGGNTNIENFPWLYRFTISRESMLENDITLLDVKIKFIKYWEEFMNDTSATKKKNILSKIANGCIISNFDNSEQPTIHIRYDINNLDNFSLVEIGQHMLNKISMKGVATIEKVDKVEKQKVIEYDDNGGVKPDIYEYVIYTTGIDLNKIKTNKYINFNSTYINDINTIYVNFGIEAARTLIMKEIETAYSGNDINSAHGGLLADVMCNTGNITSIDRHGINRLDTDPLSRASFEKTVEQLITASAFNEVDHMRSVSSRIMAGRCIKGGTGFCDVFLDSEMLENSEYTKQKKYIEIRGAELEENSVIKDTLIRTEIQDIFIPV